jgi:heme-degrading monooxygenase HmoA
MIVEIAIIDIKTGENAAFEANLEKAQAIINQSKGYISHEFHQCIEQENRYMLFIRWETLEAHTVGFRESDLFKEWRGLIGQFFATPPNVQHYDMKFEQKAKKTRKK